MDDKQFLKKLGQRIVQLRKANNLTQIDLSSSINIEDSALRRIESGRTNPTVKTLRKIAKELGVSVSELLDI